jgi:hypothetical protein
VKGRKRATPPPPVPKPTEELQPEKGKTQELCQEATLLNKNVIYDPARVGPYDFRDAARDPRVKREKERQGHQKGGQRTGPNLAAQREEAYAKYKPAAQELIEKYGPEQAFKLLRTRMFHDKFKDPQTDAFPTDTTLKRRLGFLKK